MAPLSIVDEMAYAVCDRHEFPVNRLIREGRAENVCRGCGMPYVEWLRRMHRPSHAGQAWTLWDGQP